MPLTGAKITITTDEKIDPQFGTGVVYYCSSGDAQFLDWETRHSIADHDKKYILDPDGRMNDEAGEYKGLTIAEAKQRIVSDLDKLGVIKKVEKIEQTVKVHERCDTPIEYVTSKQWFIKIADQKDTWLELGRQIKWYPENRYSDYENWVNGLNWDWCISRQRYYGVPIPVWYDKRSGEPVLPSLEFCVLPVVPCCTEAPLGALPLSLALAEPAGAVFCFVLAAGAVRTPAAGPTPKVRPIKNQGKKP